MKQLLSLQDCLDCRDCCYYHKGYLHLAPAFEKTAKVKKSKVIDKKTHFIARCSRKKDSSHFFCDFRDGDKCGLKERRPFACKLYPFNVMRDRKGNVVLGIDFNCKGIKKKSGREIKEYAEYLIPTIRRKIKNKLFYVEPFQKELRIIANVQRASCIFKHASFAFSHFVILC